MATFSNDFTLQDASAFGSDFDFTEGVRRSVSLEWELNYSVSNSVQLDWELLPTNEVRQSVSLPYSSITAPSTKSLPWLNGLSARKSIPFSVRAATDLSLDWELLPLIRAEKSLPFSIRTGLGKSLPFTIRAGVEKSALWSNPRSRVRNLDWDLVNRVNTSISAPYKLTTSATQSISSKWTNVSVDRVSRSVGATWGLLTAANVLVLPNDQQLTITSTGEVIPFKSCTLQSDEATWSWVMSLVMVDAASWQKLRPIDGPIEIQIDVRGYTFNLLSEGAGRNRDQRGINYTIKGRSPTARLSKTLSDQITKTWLSTTAKTIAQELCDEAGVTLDWTTADWPISRHEVSARYPIDIINQLTKAVGGVVQTTTDGVLTVRPKYLHSPNTYASVTPDHTISDIDDIFTMSETWESRQGYDHIEVGNETIDTEPSISISTEDAGGGAVLVKVSVVPFQTVDLEHTALDNMELLYQGIVEETHTETVEIVDGKGRIANPFYGLISSAYKYTDLGSFEVTEAGNITTAVGLHSLLDITYTTKHHTWRATSDEAKGQIYVNEVV